MDKHKTKVIFRKWKTKAFKGTIDAVFPYEQFSATCDCTCYSHIGQHSGGNYNYIYQKTVPATPEEYTPLIKELETIGYNLKVMKRRRI